MARVVVLRLGHRRERDTRITTHCGLVARAFGASEIILSGEEDNAVMEKLKDVVERWGGPFEISYVKNWKDFIKEWKERRGIVVHLTMYGIPIQKAINEIKEKFKDSDLLVIIGAEKVPKEAYFLADFNVSITNQPHSEVAALAIFLDRLFQGKELEREFENWKVKIIPQKRGKVLVKRDS